MRIRGQGQPKSPGESHPPPSSSGFLNRHNYMKLELLFAIVLSFCYDEKTYVVIYFFNKDVILILAKLENRIFVLGIKIRFSFEVFKL